MRLFGDILPFIGFRAVWIPRLEAVEWGITNAPYNMNNDCVKVEVFEVEWFGMGYTFFAKGVPK